MNMCLEKPFNLLYEEGGAGFYFHILGLNLIVIASVARQSPKDR